MFGYKLVSFGDHCFKMAEVEKAILDYFHMNSRLANEGEFEELRINQELFFEKVDMEKMNRYLAEFKNKSLEKRISKFMKFIHYVKS